MSEVAVAKARNDPATAVAAYGKLSTLRPLTAPEHRAVDELRLELNDRQGAAMAWREELALDERAGVARRLAQLEKALSSNRQELPGELLPVNAAAVG